MGRRLLETGLKEGNLTLFMNELFSSFIIFFSIHLQYKETRQIREKKKKIRMEKQRNKEISKQTKQMSELAYKEW